MELFALAVLGIVAGCQATYLAAAHAASLRARRAARRRSARHLPRPYDPARERRAERRAEALLESVVNEEEWEMYRDLGFVRVCPGAAPDVDGDPGYAYLIYPHKPIVAYEPATGHLLNEYCADFLDPTGDLEVTRLPAADDVLAKWLALCGDEKLVIRRANMHIPGRQVDPDHVRRDLFRLRNWRAHRASVTVRAA